MLSKTARIKTIGIRTPATANTANASFTAFLDNLPQTIQQLGRVDLYSQLRF